MNTPFFKLHLLENDFIFIKKTKDIENNINISKICNRKLGIGADGVVFYDFDENNIEIILYNSDGTMAGHPGNAMFCAAYLYSELSNKINGYVIDREEKHSFVVEDNKVCFSLNTMENIHVKKDHFELFGKNKHKIYLKNSFIYEEIEKKGNLYPDFNVEFVYRDNNGINVKVWENGVGLTSGSATGALAVFGIISKDKKDEFRKSVSLYFDGGKFDLEYHGNDKVKIFGRPELVFKGEY